MSVWIYGVRNTNSNIHFTWIVLKQNVMKTMYLINIQYHIIIIDCTKGQHRKSSPLENQRHPRLRLGSIGFLVVTISHVTLSCNQDGSILIHTYPKLIFLFWSRQQLFGWRWPAVGRPTKRRLVLVCRLELLHKYCHLETTVCCHPQRSLISLRTTE